MEIGPIELARRWAFLFMLAVAAMVAPGALRAAPYAAVVMDARSGEILYAENADSRLHPASLTKMMMLYVLFEAVTNGELSMDTVVTVSRNAASEPPSKLGLKTGQKIALRYLVRAAAVKSANDAATAIGEAVSGSEAAFARRMNRTAAAMGLTRTTFANANGLTAAGHLSSARDMTVLGRRLFYDYPQYYNIFSREATDAGGRTVANTNRRFLAAYKGADGIKTGYTNAAGFNLVASAERGNERIVATVFGGQSTAWRNARMAELLDLGFAKAPSRVAITRNQRPPYLGRGDVAAPVMATSAAAAAVPATAGGVRIAAVSRSLVPALRPATAVAPAPAAADLTKATSQAIVAAVAAAAAAPSGPAGSLAGSVVAAAPRLALLAQGSPDLTTAQSQGLIAVPDASALVPAVVAMLPSVPTVRPRPAPRRSTAAEAPPPATAQPVMAAAAAAAAPATLEVVTRVSTSGGRHWGINVGRYDSRYQAERMLLKTALAEIGTLDEALRKVVGTSGGFDANFVGLTEEMADMACRRLTARDVQCHTIGPG